MREKRTKSRDAKWWRRWLACVNDHRPPRTVHQILQKRRQENQAIAGAKAHRRRVLREGANGYRCWECRDVPIHPWEPVYPRDEYGITRED